MLRTIVLLLLIAVVAAVLGLGSIEGMALWMVRVLLLVFVVLLILSVVTGRRPRI